MWMFLPVLCVTGVPPLAMGVDVLRVWSGGAVVAGGLEFAVC